MNTKKVNPIVVGGSVEIIGHRGDRILPENTMPALTEAFRQGASLEYDVFSPQKGGPRLYHDTKSGRIFKLPKVQKKMHRLLEKEVDQLVFNKEGHEATVAKILGPGSRYITPYQVESVGMPKLEAVLNAFPNTKHYIELKVSNPALFQAAHNELENKVVQMIRHKKLYDRVCVVSFSPRSLRKVKALDPHIKTGLNFILPKLVRNNTLFLKFFVNVYAKRWVGVNSLNPCYDTATPKLVELAHQAGMPIITWVYHHTREQEQRLFPQLIARGVDGIMTNSVGLLKQEHDKNIIRKAGHSQASA